MIEQNIILFVVSLVWLISALWAGTYAKERGQSFGGYFLLVSLLGLIGVAITLIVLSTKDKTLEAQANAALKVREARAERDFQVRVAQEMIAAREAKKRNAGPSLLKRIFTMED